MSPASGIDCRQIEVLPSCYVVREIYGILAFRKLEQNENSPDIMSTYLGLLCISKSEVSTIWWGAT
jgi:hypothetical protein